ncbi:hypothetical protein PENTCL1PPCAC_22049 [Pristionchus entomophagus]|uniref:Uncharacterized protein n=1 Tax=Pristionchus entomophagus TaxID=358040 RepID=A0AAV5U0C9_9BILA|nr:hypothetical protein PENTCL1PPCAC_22049 [Pristionchus entomophagus]
MAFWNRAALLPWPLINNNNANNYNNGGGGGGAVAVPGVPPPAGAAPGAPAPPPVAVINPVARAAAAVGVRAAARRGLRGVLGGARGWAPGVARRHQSDTSTAREHDEKGDDLRLHVGEEITDRFARLKSNQHLAAKVPRTGVVDLERATTLSDEREAAERALLDRFVSYMEKAVGDGIEGGATEQAEAELLQELRAWQQRVRQEREQNAEARAYLLARRAELAQKEAALNAACRHIKAASTQMTLPPAPVWSRHR